MRLPLTLPLALLVAAALPACGGPPADAPPPGATADTTVSRADAAVSRANRLEDRLALPDSRTATVTEPGGDVRLVRLWEEGGQPVLLIATDPERAGRPGSRVLYYFERGRLFYVAYSDARYVIENDEIAEWLDPRLNPVPGRTPGDRQTRSAEIRQTVARYLAAFE